MVATRPNRFAAGANKINHDHMSGDHARVMKEREKDTSTGAPGAWPPSAAASQTPEGTHRFGSTGQLWCVKDGAWTWIKEPTPEQLDRTDNKVE